jgi:SAM-dependent methyltransferase
VLGVTETFGQNYAGAYDAIYRSKDYAGEADLVEQILLRHGLFGPKRILDLGCGTGNHALPLAKRGHTVIGVDRSPAMLEQARAKASATHMGSVEFWEGDIRAVDLAQRFDAVLMMFTVLGYQREDGDLMAALATTQRHLEPRGLFIFDVWNGLAVMADPPHAREIAINEGNTHLVRKTSAELDAGRQLCRVIFDLKRTDSRGRTEQWQEEHVVRYYFPEELERVLSQNQLDLLSLRSFPDNEAPVDEHVWNVIGVARAR